MLHINAVDFFHRLEVRLAELGKTKVWLAQQIGLSPNSLATLLKHKRLPRVDSGFKMARALGVSIGWLVAGEKAPDFSGRQRLEALIAYLAGLSENELEKVEYVLKAVNAISLLPPNNQ
jgi:transcriptional regulator with XRE-family HTH domain